MTDIELVIKIPEEIYQEAIKSGYSHLYDEDVANAIANGTPLPKGHGRLIDADTLECDCFNRTFDDYAFDCIDDAPTIIEAESER